MSYDYSPMVEMASEMIEEYGQSALLIRAGANIGTPARPQYGSPQELPVVVVDLDISETTRDGTMIVARTHKLYMRVDEGVVPASSEKVKIQGKTYEIEDAKALAPGGVVIFYEVTLVS